MKELLDRINVQIETFNANSKDNADKGNKAAGVRARKATLELEKLFKEYRKRSIALDK